MKRFVLKMASESKEGKSVVARTFESSKRTLRAMVVLFATIAAIVSSLGFTLPAHASGDYGPDTCLQGWVWRDAVANDHVCVTVDTRTQAANDNAQAAARRDPNGGPYGPDTCLQGWVWRDAVANDHVCVTVDTRTQAANDNAQAAARRDSLKLWTSLYTIPPKCNGDVCSKGSTDDTPRYRLQGDHINAGQAVVRLFRVSNNSVIQSWNVTVKQAAVGGQFSLDTGRLYCGKGSADSYFRVYDSISGRVSAPYYVKSICYTL